MVMMKKRMRQGVESKRRLLGEREREEEDMILSWGARKTCTSIVSEGDCGVRRGRHDEVTREKKRSRRERVP